MRRHAWLMVLSLVSAPAVVQAQTVISPTKLTFTASPDHSATKLDGTAVVSSYEGTAVAMNQQGALVWSFNIGKPTPAPSPDCTPAGSTCIVWALPTVLPITVETLYTMTVIAKGLDGNSSPSPESNPFGVAGTRVPGAVSNVKVK